MRRTSHPGHFRLPRHYWRYQLLYAAGQLASSLVGALCIRRDPCLSSVLLFLVPLVLSFATVFTFGPADKVGLVVESERLIVAGRAVQFAEVLHLSHRIKTERFDGGEGASIIHTWTLSVRLLGEAELVIYRTIASYPDGDYTVRPDPRGQNMARVLQASINVWHSSTPWPLVLALREDLQTYRRYRPVPRRWQAPLESPYFAFITLIIALFAAAGALGR